MKNESQFNTGIFLRMRHQMPHFLQLLIAHGVTVCSFSFIPFSISFFCLWCRCLNVRAVTPFSTSVRKDTFYFFFHYTPSILILSASCAKKKKIEEKKLTGGDESKGETGDGNGGELIRCWPPAKN